MHRRMRIHGGLGCAPAVLSTADTMQCTDDGWRPPWGFYHLLSPHLPTSVWASPPHTLSHPEVHRSSAPSCRTNTLPTSPLPSVFMSVRCKACSSQSLRLSTLEKGGSSALSPRRVTMPHDNKTVLRPIKTALQLCSSSKHWNPTPCNSKTQICLTLPRDIGKKYSRASVNIPETNWPWSWKAAALKGVRRLAFVLPLFGCLCDAPGGCVGQRGTFLRKRGAKRSCFNFQASISHILDLK